MNKQNFILLSDAYKYTHWMQYPKTCTKIYSYLESRGTELKDINHTIFFGLQYVLKKYFEGQVIESWMIDEAEETCRQVFGFEYFNRKGWEHILNKHGGVLPIKIRAVPEGTRVPHHNVLLTIENTDPEVPWLTNFIESLILQVWYPITVSTMSNAILEKIYKFARMTSDFNGHNLLNSLAFHLNDFGFRGVSSVESAGIGGMAHLINFKGTDNVHSIKEVEKYYKSKDEWVGGSVFASEHSTTTVWGVDNEARAVKHFLESIPSEAIASLVGDSNDIYNFVSNILGIQLKDMIMNRSGKVVCRPDSGYPPQMSVWILRELYKKFGGKPNSKGFIQLDPHVGVIYGDWISLDMIDKILSEIITAGFDVSNIIFGMGGKLLQDLNRDTFKMAIKCSSAVINDKQVDVWKAPVSDLSKVSKRGELKLVSDSNNELITVTKNDPRLDIMDTVFLNGALTKNFNIADIRTKIQNGIVNIQ